MPFIKQPDVPERVNVYETALSQMTLEEQECIKSLQRRIASYYTPVKLGSQGALEFLGALGMILNKKIEMVCDDCKYKWDFYGACCPRCGSHNVRVVGGL